MKPSAYAAIAMLTFASLVSAEPLWTLEQPVPKAAELREIEGVQFHVIKPHVPERDGYQWLHGVALAWHKSKLFASFGLNKGEENTKGEEARGRTSSDGGKTWGELFTIGVGDEPDLSVSHGVLLSHGDELWAFQGAFYDRMKKVHTRAYRLNESTGAWEKQGVVVRDGFWPMQEPIRMADGNWIMSGIRVGDGNPAAVAISQGDDLRQWKLVVIPRAPRPKMWGESSVIVEGSRVLNIARFGEEPIALVAVSNDYGSTWTQSAPSNLPMATSKPYTGTLATGSRYLICSNTADTGARRSPLTLAVGQSGEHGFSAIYRIRNSECPQSPGESNPKVAMSYPYATEHNGYLYVGYSNNGGRRGNRNSAELAVIPLAGLKDR